MLSTQVREKFDSMQLTGTAIAPVYGMIHVLGPKLAYDPMWGDHISFLWGGEFRLINFGEIIDFNTEPRLLYRAAAQVAGRIDRGDAADELQSIFTVDPDELRLG